MWEARYAFPKPQRLPSGHRRYSEQDIERVLTVARGREEGLPLQMAIDRARQLGEEPRPSVYGALREEFSHLHPHLLPKPALRHISRAIEDECCARAPHPLLFACFQHERFYRQVQPRWKELARTAETAIVLADFPRLRRPLRAPIEVPIAPQDPLMREWVVVCDAPEWGGCLAAWERPDESAGSRHFETIWTVEPDVVREAARICAELVAREEPELVADLRRRLVEPTPAPSKAGLRAVVELATRITVYATTART
jgi:MerR family transcriptional regulator, light-induced transcriptional regulator